MADPGFYACILLVVTSVTTTIAGSVLDNLHYEGCYDSGFSLRQKYHHHIPSVTLTKCVEYCLGLKTKYAGVETSDNFCYCGGDIAEESVKRNDTLCNIPCSDEPIRTCGGDWMLSLYDILGANASDTNGNMDFLIGLSTGVRLYHSKDDIQRMLMTTSDWAHSVDYHFSKSIAYAFSRKRIYNASLQSSGDSISPGQVVKDVSSCDGFAVDWVHDRIYWADCNTSGAAIKVMGLEGDAEHTVLSAEELNAKVIKRMEVDPYKGVIFWTADGVIQTCRMSGDGFISNLTEADMNVRAISLDRKLRRVYYVGSLNQSTSLFSMDYTGKDLVEHFNIQQIRNVYGLSILGDKVFWVNYANVRDVIYEAPINLTTNEDVKVIKIIERAVWHMKLVHPSLQMRPKIDPCLDKGCDHSCVARGGSASCVCPPGQKLRIDGVSCRIVQANAVPQVGSSMLFVSVLMVIAVLLVSLGLMYVANKYWSLLENKLYGISYSRSKDRTNVNEVERELGTASSEDTVNLV